MDHSFSNYVKFSGKLTFLTPLDTHTSAYQGIKDIYFSENFAYVLNE